MILNTNLFVQDAAHEVLGEISGQPDLVIGNYSDGNLVATLLAHKLGVTQVCQLTLACETKTGFYIRVQLLRLVILALAIVAGEDG